MKRNWVLFAWAALLGGIVSLFIFHLYDEGTRTVLSRFQEHQLSHAQHLSKQIQYLIQARAQGLRALGSFPSFQHGDAKQQRAAIQAFSRQIEKDYVKRVSLYDESAALVYSTDSNPPLPGEVENAVFSWAKKLENKDRLFVTPVFFEPSYLTFILATPLYHNHTDSRLPKPVEKFLGVLTFTVDMKGFLTYQLDSVASDLSLDQIWIMNNDGTLLFQSVHQEKHSGMVSRSIRQREASCDQCHFSFRYAEDILNKKQGTVEYRLENHPNKIAAFAPMEFENVSWVIVVSAPYDEVTSFVRKSLREHLFLWGVVVFALSMGSALILRSERMKARAEEEAARWQERMAERKKAEDTLQLERNKLREILDSMSDGVCIVGQRNEIQYVNPVIEREFGLVNGRKCHDYFHDRPEVCPWCKNREVFEGKTVRWEWHFSKTDKTYELIDTPMMTQDGTLSKLEIFHDVTERERVGDALRESKKQLRDLSSQLLTAQETERKRISRELHDELGQALTAMKLRMNFIEKNLSSKNPAELKQECRYGIEYIDQVIEDVRRLSRDLSPTILEDFGLYAAIRWLLNNFSKNYHVKVTLEMIDIDSLIPRHAHVIVYRIVQEALTNIGKHSQARNVSVAASTDGITVFLSVEDDGVGFDPERAFVGDPSEKGLGLATMKGRAGMLGGDLSVRTQPGRGTRITLTIPIKRGGTS